MSSLPLQEIDEFLDVVDIRVDAFAICEIGRTHRLKVDPVDQVLVHFVLKGEGFLDCESQRLRLCRGAVALVPKNLAKSLCGLGPVEEESDMRSACPLEDGLISFHACHGEADLVLGCAKLSASTHGNLSLFDQIEHPVIIDTEKSLGSIFDTLLAELREPRVGSRAFISALMKQIFIVVLRSEPGDAAALLQQRQDPRLAAVAAAILSNPECNHTVESLARNAGMSRSRFNGHFTSTYQCSPMEFVRSARLSSAARLLKDSDLPVKAIAASVGYASRSQFSHAFQSKFGLAPSAFRRSTGGVRTFAGKSRTAA